MRVRSVFIVVVVAGSRQELPNKFKVKEYCPVVFKSLRARFGEDPVDYVVREPVPCLCDCVFVCLCVCVFVCLCDCVFVCLCDCVIV